MTHKKESMTDKKNNEWLDDNSTDERISKTVQSLHFRLPETLDQKVNAALADAERTDLTARTRKPAPWKWLPAAAAVMILIISGLFLFQPANDGTNGQETKPPISEIKTEFELAHANIKIIWVQKRDFNLNKGTNP